MRWFDELRAKYTAGVAHCFLLHGAVDDYVVPGVSLPNFLCLALGRTRDLILCYNIADGVTFPAPSMRRNCVRWLELTPPKPDPVAAVLEAQYSRASTLVESALRTMLYDLSVSMCSVWSRRMAGCPAPRRNGSAPSSSACGF